MIVKPRRLREYALYKGEKLLAMGTPAEIAEEMGIKVGTVLFMACPAHLRKYEGKKERAAGRRVLVEIEGE